MIKKTYLVPFTVLVNCEGVSKRIETKLEVRAYSLFNMILNLDKQPREALAAIDAQGNQLTYGELCKFSNELAALMPSRSLLFLLTENNVGGIAWGIGCMAAKQVPLILNAHTEDTG